MLFFNDKYYCPPAKRTQTNSFIIKPKQLVIF